MRFVCWLAFTSLCLLSDVIFSLRGLRAQTDDDDSSIIVAVTFGDVANFTRNDDTACTMSDSSSGGQPFYIDKKNDTCAVACQCSLKCINNDSCSGFIISPSGIWCLLVRFDDNCENYAQKSWTYYQRIGITPAENASLQMITKPTTTPLPQTDWQYHENCRCLCRYTQLTTTTSTTTTTRPTTTTTTVRLMGKRAANDPPPKAASAAANMPFIVLQGGGRLSSLCPEDLEPNPPQWLLAKHRDFIPLAPNATTTPRNPSAIPRVYSKFCRCFCNAYN